MRVIIVASAMLAAAPALAQTVDPVTSALDSPIIISPLPADARQIGNIEIKRLLRDRILLTAFPQREQVRTMTVDGRTSDIELFHRNGKWRLPGHWVTWTIGRYRVARGEVCISYRDPSGTGAAIRRCRAFFRAPDGAVYTRDTSRDGQNFRPDQQPALRAWTEPFSWLRDNAPYGIDYGV